MAVHDPLLATLLYCTAVFFCANEIATSCRYGDTLTIYACAEGDSFSHGRAVETRGII